MSEGSGFGTVMVVLAAIFLISKCNQSGEPTTSVANVVRDRAEFDEDAARENAASELAGTTYADAGQPYGCTEDCSGHEAGFEWAQENDVTDTSDCSGNSQSFVEGCEAYAEELQRKVEDEEEAGTEE